MRKKNQLYEVEIKSMALLRENKRSFITYFSGGNKKTIASNCRHLYPQYTNPDDKPVISITPISQREYNARKNDNIIKQKQVLVKAMGEFK